MGRWPVLSGTARCREVSRRPCWSLTPLSEKSSKDDGGSHKSTMGQWMVSEIVICKSQISVPSPIPSPLLPLIFPGSRTGKRRENHTAPCRSQLLPPLSLPSHEKVGTQGWDSPASVILAIVTLMSPPTFPAWLDDIHSLLIVTLYLQG